MKKKIIEIKNIFLNRYITVSKEYRGDLKLISIADNIRQYFDSSESEFLKNDHSTSVIKIKTEDGSYIARRDNSVSYIRFIRRLFKKSRSMKTWNKARWLNDKGLETIVPCAVIEDYVFFVRVRSFIILECIEGVTFKSYLSNASVSKDEKLKVSSQIISLVKYWHSFGIKHGDPKGPNIIVGTDKVTLIDIEDAAAPVSNLGQRKAFAKDWAIILHNLQPYKYLRIKALNEVYGIFDGDPEYFSKHLVKKCLAQEYLLARKSFNEIIPPVNIDAVISGKQILPGWEEKINTDKFVHHIQHRDGLHIISSFGGAIRAPSNVKGILSLALSLKIFGIGHVEILDGGYTGENEYLIYSTAQTENVQEILKKLENQPNKQVELINKVGETLGMLHLLGFIHGNLCLSNLYVKNTDNGDAVLIASTVNTRWYGKRIGKKISDDLSELHQQLGNSCNSQLLEAFKIKYNLAFNLDYDLMKIS